ncbi:Hypothetical_protein [Hexamita inflata]|uniref:Hypothetical_protein n=1 Tax=Hexamita inflata TaxID=28002 RepID=A0AA86RN87_9EUKA|nr:Hypothetical protein HINF_LOCUS56983 [Hexamita inflata]CAI9975109.1 Hypothetical protein HINF_LOCUS62754 [Hexamita inflata]
MTRKFSLQNEAQGRSETEKEKVPSLQVTRSKDHQKAPIQRKVSSKGNLEKKEDKQPVLEPYQVNEPMHQRQPSSSNANTTEQPLVQTEENNKQKETEKRELVSQKQVNESAHVLLSKVSMKCRGSDIYSVQSYCWIGSLIIIRLRVVKVKIRSNIIRWKIKRTNNFTFVI